MTTPEQFFDTLSAAYQAAVSGVGESRRRLIMAGVRIEVCSASHAIDARFADALAHHPTRFDGEPDLTVCLWENGGALPPLPWRFFPDMYTDDYGPQGEIAGFNDARFGTIQMQWVHELTVIDRARRIALYTVGDAASQPYWFSAFPLRGIVHLWARDRAMQLMHAAAVGRPDGGVLIAGASGAGKSTTALACLLPESGAHGLRIAGDDYAAVDGIGTGYPVVRSLFSVVKLVPGARVTFPDLIAHAHNPDARPDEKFLIPLHAAAPDRLIDSFPLRAIVLPRITGERESRVVAGRPIDALRTMAVTTLFQTISDKPVSFDKLRALVRSVPVLTLLAGTDIAAIPGVIARALDSLSERSS